MEAEALSDLEEAWARFDSRVEMTTEENELLTSIPAESRIFEDVSHLLQLNPTRIVSIAEIHNPILTQQYIACKENVDCRVGHHDTERFLFHGCSSEAALGIINSGFDSNMIGLRGKPIISFGQIESFLFYIYLD